MITDYMGVVMNSGFNSATLSVTLFHAHIET